MLPLLLLVSFAQAAPAVPVRLPPQEATADWSEALGLAGLAVGTLGDGPWVEIVAGPSQWTVRVRDRAGVLHETPVPPPRTPQEREDLALLAASLVQPMGVAAPVAPAAPPPAPAPKPKPRPTVEAPPPPEPAPAPPPAPATPGWPPTDPVTPVPIAAAPPAPEPPPPAPPPAPRLAARLGLAGEARPATRPTAVGWAELQLEGPSAVRPALGVAITAPAALPALATEVSFWGAEAWAGAWYAADAPVRFDVGLAAGLAARAFVQDGEDRGVAWVPTLATRVEVPVRVAPWLTIEPGAHLVTDLAEIDLTSRSEGAVRFGDWAARVSVGFRPAAKNPPTP